MVGRKLNIDTNTLVQGLSLTIVVGFALLGSVIIAKTDMKVGIMILVLPAVIWVLSTIFKKPISGLYMLIGLSFLAMGISKYLRGVPLGLVIDGLLALTIVGILFKEFYTKDWRTLNNTLIWLSLIWLGYTVFEILNPLSKSFVAWFYAVRGISIYMIAFVMIGCR